MYGDFDIVIPNVSKEKFKEMLRKNFYCYEDNKCIVFEKEKLEKLPSSFHLLIEIGIDAFHIHTEHKKKQIKKYISLINIRNKIMDDSIRNKYISNFEKRLSLHFNSKNRNISQTYVYMLISNSDFSSFTHRFLENKSYEKDYNNEFENICAIAPDEFICCGFVNFEKNLNSNVFLKKKVEDQDKKIEEQNKKMEEQNKKMEEQNKKIEEQNKKIEEQNKIIKNLEQIVKQIKCQQKKKFPIKRINRNRRRRTSKRRVAIRVKSNKNKKKDENNDE